METQTWRRKHCKKCGITLTSKEVLDLSSLIMIGDSPYSRHELAGKLKRWISKRTEDDLFSIVDTVEQGLIAELRHKKNGALARETYFDLIGEILTKVDPPAAMRMQADRQEG